MDQTPNLGNVSNLGNVLPTLATLKRQTVLEILEQTEGTRQYSFLLLYKMAERHKKITRTQNLTLHSIFKAPVEI
jgi:hypothetical protein